MQVELLIYMASLLFPIDEEDIDLNGRLQVLSIVSGQDNPDGIPYAAAAGDVDTMRQHLEKFPDEVRIIHMIYILHHVTYVAHWSFAHILLVY